MNSNNKSNLEIKNLPDKFGLLDVTGKKYLVSRFRRDKLPGDIKTNYHRFYDAGDGIIFAFTVLPEYVKENNLSNFGISKLEHRLEELFPPYTELPTVDVLGEQK